MIAHPPPAIAAAAPNWQSAGISSSGLRIFVDRNSLVQRGAIRSATVRLGSPGTITGRIVKVIERVEFDCRKRRWRLLGYTAFAEDDRVVRPSRAPQLPSAFMPITRGSLGEAIAQGICLPPR